MTLPAASGHTAALGVVGFYPSKDGMQPSYAAPLSTTRLICGLPQEVLVDVNQFYRPHFAISEK